jgi:peptidyl-prolyl cis-trans isomerase D
MLLQKFRDRLTGIMAIFILGLLAVPFALVGVNSYFAPDTENNVAIVNEEGITLADYNASFQNYRERMRSLLGENFDAERFDDAIIRRQHLDTMIDRELLRQIAAETGLSVDDQFLAQAIRELPGFQVNGEFSVDVYQSQLSAQGMTPQQFENQMRASMVLSQYPSTISASAIATPREVDEYIRLQEQKRVFAALLVPTEADEAVGEVAEQLEQAEEAAELEEAAESTEPEAVVEEQQVDDVPADMPEERILAWYEEHADQYRNPERVIVEFLELDAARLEADEPVDEDTLRQRFDDQSGRFIAPEARLASHILIEVSPTADEAEVETARERAQELYDRVIAGEEFAGLAREFSEDQGSAPGGGDLDWIEPGFMVEAFENALYELSMEAPVSEPVQTGFGWHIIELRDIRPAEGMSFEEARPTLEAELVAERNERRFIETADRLVDIIYEDPTTLEAASDELGLEIQVTGPFDRSGGEAGVAANPEFVEAAFSDLVLLQDSASDPVDLGPNHIAVLRIREHMPEAPRPLDEVRDDVIAAIIRDDALNLAEERAAALLERLDAGESLALLAEETGNELLESEGAARNAADLAPELRQGLFEMAAPAEGEVTRGLVPLSDGFAVVELVEVIPGALSEEEAARRDAYRRRLANVTASSETQAFLRMLRAQSEVQVFEERL